MAGFVVAGIVIALLAFGVVLRPLWREARGLAASVAVLLLAASTALYWLVGAPGAITQPTDSPATPRSLDEAIVQLRAALASHPEQAEGWVLLGRSLSSQQKFAEARDAFARAVALRPDEADVLVAAAQARMLADDSGRPDPEAMRLLEHALAVQPDHQRARWFLGVVQRQAGEPAKASATWEPLLRVVDASTRPGLLEQINAARQDARLEPIQAPAAPTAAAASGKRLQVRVTLDAEFAKRAGLPGDTSVFVIARAADTPMPVAVEKHALRELPLTITLDDGDSPMPTRTLSSLDNVQLLARLSRSGNAMRQADDVESAPVTVALPAAAPVELVIGR
ncbi:tetratricopeptide repeat protein [Xanthomonas euvesicatoria pv. eucalypti]|uniref:tetratricopeptide repeat protein n=1 Tax=Xanthomonas euvesicatoria TaxID=456327 RepID=UPI0026E11C41|nr:tetratricopeptide repeat protein [Xanthomonas euvesicatoria]MDO7932516.1 tetratricopeptide repeat protein [Xanthomonas euvesicatoria pv. eucalypti]MDO7936799.1 tetratricopeptide repeat protein [Xanthomonas euvesicatoria pv. eucalypti]MDO7940914.1 tetratricopeptide repeat protein [Xanthomonas euvesicatoria pv. eucalypti]MDO7943663.1 tetratricopeptide repeat protein [Xanthomonas euvesicatoria pv. eucalypti]MDO7947911.1 tetratricopeptide repeat protein [Xanthomonas euvesicatoria pv. eucalypti]